MPELLPRPTQFSPNIVIIGMAGAGKTTVGKVLASKLGWAFADTDHLIEAARGTCLQAVADSMTKEEFLDVEADQICSLELHRTVIATGGSVVYRRRGMEHLKSMGPLVWLDVELDEILERIARHPDRGLAIAPGQTVEDLFREREALYREYADIRLVTRELTPYACADRIKALLAGRCGF